MTGVNDVSKIDYNKRAVTLAKELYDRQTLCALQ